RMLCEVLGGVSSHQPDVAADFAVLPGDWTDRCRYWMQVLGSVEGGIKHFKQHVQETNEFPPGFVNEFVRFIPKLIDHSLRMADFDRLPGPDMQVFRVEDLPPEGKVANRVLQAERARSMGDFVTAVEHLRCAIQHVPSDAGVHFKLGAILGEKGALTGDMAAMEEALLELRVAVELDPDFGNARNEIGIVLSNMRRHEDAEAAFAEAEPYHGEHAHHWFTRGNNYIALKQYEAASAALEKAIELSKNHEHVEAQTMLSATLMALGQTRDARRIAKHVKHRVGFDPAEAWRQVLGIWDIRVPVVS
ncbi:MAG TPA: tetratricopeptide repeat protein, partial [Planctomycetaceae bacterium]|nr:tetratricopeptide repeat protein [Planctomycetaceae bacterium]